MIFKSLPVYATSPVGGWTLKQAKPVLSSRSVGKCSEAHGVVLGASCVMLGVGLDDPTNWMVPLTQHVL